MLYPALNVKKKKKTMTQDAYKYINRKSNLVLRIEYKVTAFQFFYFFFGFKFPSTLIILHALQQPLTRKHAPWFQQKDFGLFQ